LDSVLKQAGLALKLHGQGTMEVVPTIAANHQQSIMADTIALSEGSNLQAYELEFLKRNNALFLGEYLTQSQAVHAKQGIIDIFQEGGDIVGDLEHLFTGIVDAPNNYFKTYTVNALNNARTYAQLATFNESGVKYFEIVAVLDGRTTNICRSLHGKRFPVQPALQNMEAFFQADSIDKIKELSPMVYGDSTEGFTIGYGEGATPLDISDSNAMIRANVMSPPFHFNCRSHLAPVYN
jgi:SPP1 gp7 family putative phage head morphogenesis protein